MKREAPSCSKMKRLCKRLSIRQYMGIGILESLWHLTAREAPHGDLGKLDDEDIALYLDYEGDPGVLIQALVDSKWLDRCPCHRLTVHDWHEHADDATKKKVERSQRPFVSRHGPTPVKSGSLPEPEPEPEPEPVKANTTAAPSAALVPEAEKSIDHFPEDWPKFWRPLEAREDARRAYRKAVKLIGREALMAHVAVHGPYQVALAEQGRRRPIHQATWLNGQRWNDEIVPLNGHSPPGRNGLSRQQQATQQFLARAIEEMREQNG